MRKKFQRKDLLSELKKLEDTYQMSSSDFYSRFTRGELGDAADYVLWASLYEMAFRANLVPSPTT
jgi:hypothetical protein